MLIFTRCVLDLKHCCTDRSVCEIKVQRCTVLRRYTEVSLALYFDITHRSSLTHLMWFSDYTCVNWLHTYTEKSRYKLIHTHSNLDAAILFACVISVARCVLGPQCMCLRMSIGEACVFTSGFIGSAFCHYLCVYFFKVHMHVLVCFLTTCVIRTHCVFKRRTKHAMSRLT